MQMRRAAQSCFSLLPVSNATLVSAGDAAVEGGEAGFSPVSASNLLTQNKLAYGMAGDVRVEAKPAAILTRMH